MADPMVDVLICTCHHVGVDEGMSTDSGVPVSAPRVPSAWDRELDRA